MGTLYGYAAVGCLLALGVTAGAPTPALSQSLTNNEVKGTNLSGKWRGQAGLVTRGPDGKVIFLFGETQPSVVCSPLQVCDIELQGGRSSAMFWLAILFDGRSSRLHRAPRPGKQSI